MIKKELPEGKNILITGGAGFIGVALALKLAEKNSLTLLDIDFENTAIQYTNLKKHPNIKCLKGDILDSNIISKIIPDIHIVIHTAALLGVHKVIQNPRKTIETNVFGTANLLKTIINQDIERFIFFSTSEIFGGDSFNVNERSFIKIQSIPEARWSYSISKLVGEQLVYAYYREFNIPVVIVRPFNIFGPRRIGDHVILRFIVNALLGKDLQVHGDGTQIRSWCYIDDFVEAIISILVNNRAIGEDFNIGNSLNTLTIYELARRIKEITRSSSRIVFTYKNYTDIDLRVPHLQKAERVLGYKPKIDIDLGLRRTISWYRKHLDEFKDKF